jgi:hypothetical protein
MVVADARDGGEQPRGGGGVTWLSDGRYHKQTRCTASLPPKQEGADAWLGEVGVTARPHDPGIPSLTSGQILVKCPGPVMSHWSMGPGFKPQSCHACWANRVSTAISRENVVARLIQSITRDRNKWASACKHAYLQDVPRTCCPQPVPRARCLRLVTAVYVGRCLRLVRALGDRNQKASACAKSGLSSEGLRLRL